LNFGDGPQTAESQADALANDGQLTDPCIKDPAGAMFGLKSRKPLFRSSKSKSTKVVKAGSQPRQSNFRGSTRRKQNRAT